LGSNNARNCSSVGRGRAGDGSGRTLQQGRSGGQEALRDDPRGKGEVVGHGGADVVDLGLPIKLMSLTQLKQYCQFHSISRGDIDPSSYIEVEELREDLWNYNEDKVAYLARASKTKATRAAERAFMDLNSTIEKVNVGPATGDRSAIPTGTGTDDVL
jgi:hypothetical protein